MVRNIGAAKQLCALSTAECSDRLPLCPNRAGVWQELRPSKTFCLFIFMRQQQAYLINGFHIVVLGCRTVMSCKVSLIIQTISAVLTRNFAT